MFVNNNRDVPSNTHSLSQKPDQESKIDALVQKHTFPSNTAKSLSSREMVQISESNPLARS